jgi:hypothetical protein
MTGNIFKNKTLTILFLLLIISTTFTIAQTKKSDLVKTALINLFEYSANKDYSNVAQYFVYLGEDSTRKWVDVYDYSRESDKNDVISISDKVKNLLENGGEFEFKEFKTKKESQVEWYVWLINFEKGSKQKVYFACLKINGKYVLGNID